MDSKHWVSRVRLSLVYALAREPSLICRNRLNRRYNGDIDSVPYAYINGCDPSIGCTHRRLCFCLKTLGYDQEVTERKYEISKQDRLRSYDYQ